MNGENVRMRRWFDEVDTSPDVQEFKQGEHQKFHCALLAMGALTAEEAEKLLVTDQISVMHKSGVGGCEFHATVQYGGDPGWAVNEGTGKFHVENGEFEDALAVFAQLIDDRRRARGGR